LSFPFLAFIFFGSIISAQDKSPLSLLTQAYSERPLTLHKGQFSVFTGYELSILNKKYTNTGEIILLKEDGSAAVKNMIPFRIEYGVLEFLQLSAGLNYAKSGLRSRNRTIYGFDSYLDINELIEIKGIDQLSLVLSLRSPKEFSHLDFSVSGGLNIPLSDNKPGKPDHTYFESGGFAMLNYHYFEKYSPGVSSSQFGGALKYMHKTFSVFASYLFQSSLKDGTNIHWDGVINSGVFEYSSREYKYNTGQCSNWESIISYQAIKWFNFQLFLNGYNAKNGWSNLTGLKIGYPDMSVLYGGLGYEIQVTSNIRLSQQFRMPLQGESYSASVIFLTGINYSILQ